MKKKLSELLLDPSLLNIEITNTSGYVLEEIKKQGLSISLDSLLKNLNVFSIKFIKENFQLSEAQNENIDKFLSDDSKSFKNKNLTKEQIVYFLKNKIELPYHANIDLDILKNMPKEIIYQTSDLNRYNAERIFSRALNILSADDVKKLDREMLLEFVEQIAVNKSLMKDPSFKYFYKDLVFNYFENPRIKLFENFSFGKEDSGLLLKLLENSNSSFRPIPYASIKSIDGVSDILNKYEYVKMFKISDLEKDFSNEEVEKNKEFFQDLWLSNSENKRWDYFEDILKNESTFEQFSSVVNSQFLIKMFSNASDIHNLHSRIDKEYRNIIVDKEIYLLNEVLYLYVNNQKIDEQKHIKDIISIENIFSYIKNVKHEKTSPVNKSNANFLMESIDLNIRKIYENIIPKIFYNENIEDLLSTYKDIFDPKVISMAEDVLLKNPSINSFYIISKVISENNKHYLDYSDRNTINVVASKIMESHINNLIEKEKDPQLRKINIKLISDIANFFDINEAKKMLSSYRYENINNIGDESIVKNMFIYSKDDLININKNKFYAIYEIDKKILKDMSDLKVKISDDMFLWFLRDIENNDILNFLKKYINENEEEIINNNRLYQQLILSSKQEELIKINNLRSFEGIYTDCLLLNNEIEKIQSKRSGLSSRFKNLDWAYSFEKLGLDKTNIINDIDSFIIEENISQKEAKVIFVELYELENNKRKKFEEIKKTIPFQFVSEKIEDLLLNKNYKEVLSIKTSRLNYDQNRFVDYVNRLNYKDLMLALDDFCFFELLKKELDYDKKTNIKFNDFSENENINLLKKLKYLYEKDKSEDNPKRNYGFLHFFNKEKNHFIKKFVIENYPKDLFYSYDFIANDKSMYKPSNFIKENYTKEEILDAYIRLKNEQGFFSESDVNADYKPFFIHALFGDQDLSDKSLIDKKFKEFLDVAKNKDKALYAILANENMFINACMWGQGDNKGKTRSQVAMDYFKKTYDLDSVIEGLTDIIKEIKSESEEKYLNKDLANHAITAVIHNTYFENYDKNGRTEKYLSDFTNDETLKIINMLIENAPLHFIDRHVIGCANDPILFFNNNIDRIYSRENVENMLFPNIKVMPAYLDLSRDDSEAKERTIQYFCSIIDYAVENKDKEVIEYLSYTVQQNKFAEENLSYDAYKNLYQNKSDMILSVISKDLRILNRLENAGLKIELDEKLMQKIPTIKKKNKI